MNILLCIACGALWRIGGCINKLWRRVGCTALLSGFLILHSDMNFIQIVISIGMIGWGCWSYFAWLNPWTSDEKWYNFFAGACLIQLSILVSSYSIENAVVGLLAAITGALGKVWIDKQDWLDFIPEFKAGISEAYFGIVMMSGMIINVYFSFL